MGFREVSVVEVREVLRAWWEGHGLRKVAERAGVDRTGRRYVAAAEAAGLTRDAGVRRSLTSCLHCRVCVRTGRSPAVIRSGARTNNPPLR